MAHRLHARKVLITGGASGIGLETARLFAREGARVAILDVNPATLEQARRELGDCVAIEADVTQEAQVTDAVNEAIGRLDGLDGLVNAAGISFWRSFEEITFAEWRQILSVNLDGPFLVCKAAWPALKARKPRPSSTSVRAPACSRAAI